MQRCVDFGLELPSDFFPLFSNASVFYLAPAREELLDWANKSLDLKAGLGRLSSLLEGAVKGQVVGQARVLRSKALHLIPPGLSARMCECQRRIWVQLLVCASGIPNSDPCLSRLTGQSEGCY